jgi:hypothetical protein
MLSLDSTWPFGDGEDEPEIEIPTRIVGMWTDTVLTKPNEKPQRGFGGRLMFYAKDPNRPVAVEGELIVYAFDETGRDPADNKPTRRYVFPPDQIPLHQSKSPVGPSYSFWLPWDEAGGAQTEVSLICRFQPKGGSVVTSEQTRHRLPGKLTSEVLAAAGKGPKLPEGIPSRPARPELPSHSLGLAGLSSAQLASYEAPAPVMPPPAVDVGSSGSVAGASTPRQMTTTTISLPPNYQLPQGSTAPQSSTSAPALKPQQQPTPAMPASSTTMHTEEKSLPAPNSRRAATSYQPQPRAALPGVYQPTVGGVVPTRVANTQLQARLSNGVAPATTMHHLTIAAHPTTVSTPASQVAPAQGLVTTTSQPALMPPQPATPHHPAGTATVTYR